ncbi:MAG TPA: S8 family serine peptidase [Sedimentisphaerales bacterium]|nr:S8 family serine peptidase [Sedimentisphaerales bacterium]
MENKAVLVLAMVLAVCSTGGALATVLQIAPEEDFVSSGEPGGPFTPPSKDYQLKNVGPNTLYWGVNFPADWLDLSPTNWGELEPNESATLTVSINSEANSLPEGIHTYTLVFTDSVDPGEQTRDVILTAAFPGGIWVSPNSLDVNVIEGCTLTDSLTVGNDRIEPLDFLIRTRAVSGSGDSQASIDGALGTEATKIFSVPSGRDFTVVGGGAYKPDELIVRFAAKANGQQHNAQQKSEILRSLGGGSIKHTFKIVPGLSVVKLPPGLTVAGALQNFNRARGILYAQPNYRVQALSTIPDDSRFDDLWGMHNTGQTGGTPDADIDAPEAWDIATGSEQVIAAVIDTGVDYTHPDLATNMWRNEEEFYGAPGVDDDGNGYIDDIYGYDFCNYDGDPMDDHYHGTHCTGTVGAVGDNGEGVAGVCWRVKIMALKFLDSGGSGWTDDAIRCVEYSVLMGANLSSNSWGGDGYSQGLKDAIDAAGAAGMLFVAAAGNDNDNTDVTPHYPSGYESTSLISVMSTNKYDNKSSFSNYGPVSVDLGAPGSDILSCQLGGGYRYASGTSMATPHVAGACALMWSLNPLLSNDEIKDALLRTVDPTLAGLCVSQGRLNLHSAILEAGVPWMHIEPEEGTLVPGDWNEVMVTFDATGLTPGTYQAEIVILSSDPWNPTTVLPVTMSVVADDLQVTPAEGFDSSGTKGGPYEPACMTYTLTNIGAGPVGWTTSDTESWLEVEPNEGLLEPNETTDVNVCISAESSLFEPNLYADTVTFTNTDSNSIKPRSVTLTVRPPDLFTESFGAGYNDLEDLSLTFRPDGSTAYYEACREEANELPTDPNGGTFVLLWDDDFDEVVLSEAAEVLFYGQRYDRFYVGSNGYITFGAGDTEYSASLQNHFNLPRISALFTDLNPPNEQCISYKQLQDRVAVTFEDVPLYGDKDAKSSFQIELFFVDGAIRITWPALAATAAVVGLSQGNGSPPAFFRASDLSQYPPCWPKADLSRDYLVNFIDFAMFAEHWRDQDCNIPSWCAKSDLDLSGETDGNDLHIFVENWLVKEDQWLLPVAHWRFDEGEGNTAYDSAGNNDGNIYGAEWTTGQIDGALDFNGVADYVEIPDSPQLRFDGTEPFSVSLWFEQLADVPDNEYLLAKGFRGDPENTNYAFIIWDADNTLRWFWEYGSGTDVSLSGGVTGIGRWYHAVGVWNGKAQIIYVNGTAKNAVIPPGLPDSSGNRPVVIGRVTAGTSPAVYFNGIIDDVRVYDRALAAEEVWQLYQDGLAPKAFRPNPADGATEVNPHIVLGWSPGGYALSHDVYFGTDYNDVNDANTTDLEAFVGNRDSNSWDPCGLEYGSTYYWRVDEQSASGTAEGDVWSFTTWGEPNLYLVGWWQFDEGDGNTAYDSAGDNDGNLVGDPCRVPGYVGTYALDLDGIDDYVDCGNDSSLIIVDKITLAAWAKPTDSSGSEFIVAKWHDPTTECSYGVRLAEANPRFFLANSDQVTAITFTDLVVDANAWNHIVVTWDGSAMQAYLDGFRSGHTQLFLGPINSTTKPAVIGCNAGYAGGTGGDYFCGTVDDVRIYERALSAEEIQQLYQEGLN